MQRMQIFPSYFFLRCIVFKSDGHHTLGNPSNSYSVLTLDQLQGKITSPKHEYRSLINNQGINQPFRCTFFDIIIIEIIMIKQSSLFSVENPEYIIIMKIFLFSLHGIFSCSNLLVLLLRMSYSTVGTNNKSDGKGMFFLFVSTTLSNIHLNNSMAELTQKKWRKKITRGQIFTITFQFLKYFKNLYTFVDSVSQFKQQNKFK